VSDHDGVHGLLDALKEALELAQLQVWDHLRIVIFHKSVSEIVGHSLNSGKKINSFVTAECIKWGLKTWMGRIFFFTPYPY
jgi:hypothetical protein